MVSVLNPHLLLGLLGLAAVLAATGWATAWRWRRHPAALGMRAGPAALALSGAPADTAVAALPPGDDRRQDVFLATLAHELRNPLAPIRTAAHVLRAAGSDTARQSWAADIIHRQVTAMGLLLDDLLELSRITQGSLALNKERVVLHGVVDAALELARPALDKRGHTLTVQGDALDVSIEGDPLRLAQVLGNLLNNAARYTEPGGRVMLTVDLRAGAVELAIQDSGIGIAPADLGRVFDMFGQVRRPGGRSECGLGIGLTLVRGLVALHGGSVSAHSDGPGMGSTFRVRLPLTESAPAPHPPRAHGSRAVQAGALRVLVVDDNHDGADTMATLLEAAGHRVAVAYDGVEALALAESMRPQVALIDIGMPRLDGCCVARSIRAQDWGSGAYLIAVTGWSQPEDRQRTSACGFDRHMVKPIDPDQIVEMLADRGQRRRCAATTTG